MAAGQLRVFNSTISDNQVFGGDGGHGGVAGNISESSLNGGNGGDGGDAVGGGIDFSLGIDHSLIGLNNALGGWIVNSTLDSNTAVGGIGGIGGSGAEAAAGNAGGFGGSGGFGGDAMGGAIAYSASTDASTETLFTDATWPEPSPASRG